MIGAVVVRPLQCVEVEAVLEGAMAPCLHPPPSSHQSVVERHPLGTPLVELLVGVGEPVHQQSNILLVNGRAAPDAEAVRGVTVGADVVRDVLGLEPSNHLLQLGGLGGRGVMPKSEKRKTDRRRGALVQ